MTPLMRACRAGQLKNVKILLNNGADVNEKPCLKGRSPILYAAMYLKHAVVEYLLMQGADPFDIDNVRSCDAQLLTVIAW